LRWPVLYKRNLSFARVEQKKKKKKKAKQKKGL